MKRWRFYLIGLMILCSAMLYSIVSQARNPWVEKTFQVTKNDPVSLDRYFQQVYNDMRFTMSQSFSGTATGYSLVRIGDVQILADTVVLSGSGTQTVYMPVKFADRNYVPSIRAQYRSGLTPVLWISRGNWTDSSFTVEVSSIDTAHYIVFGKRP